LSGEREAREGEKPGRDGRLFDAVHLTRGIRPPVHLGAALHARPLEEAEQRGHRQEDRPGGRQPVAGL